MVTPASLFPSSDLLPSSDPATGPRAALALLEQLRDIGVTLRVDGPLLRAAGALQALTPELRTAIGEAKPELLALLQPARATYRCAGPCRGSYVFDAPGTYCYHCKRQGHHEPA